MAKRPQTRAFFGLLRPDATVYLVMTACGLYAISNAAKLGFDVGVPVLAVFVGAGATWLWWRSRRSRRVERMLNAKASEIVAAYLRSRRLDAFGNLDETQWRRQVDHFLRIYAYPRITDAGFKQVKRLRSYAKLSRRVDAFAARKAGERQGTDISVHAEAGLFSPREYELHCAEILQANGWRTRPTPQSRDSGADIIATLGTIQVAVECKRYSQPVGNRAVQQVYTARRLYATDLACIVAPNGFTRQAEQEALPLGVLLLHHSELPMLAKRAGVARTASPLAS